MTATADMTLIMETFLGRTVDGAQLERIADAFISNDPYHTAGWSDTKYGVGDPTISNAGTGYTEGDMLTLVGGTGTVATVSVFSEVGGVITELTVSGNGEYDTVPVNPVTLTGGSGTNATADFLSYSFDVPRLPTNEEKAQNWLDSMKMYGKSQMRVPAEFDETEVQKPIAQAAVTAAGDAAEADFE
jgi:hypothetical protein